MNTQISETLFPGFENLELQTSFSLLETERNNFHKAVKKLEKVYKLNTDHLLLKAKNFDLTKEQYDFLNLPTTTVFGGKETDYTFLGAILRAGLHESFSKKPPKANLYWVKMSQAHPLYKREALIDFVLRLDERMQKYGFIFSGGNIEKGGIFNIYVQYDYTKQHDWLK